MSFRRRCLAVALASAVACSKSPSEPPKPGSASAAQVQDAGARALPVPAGYDAEALGALRFAVSGGTPEARVHFDRGLLALHSFWYEEATAQFQRAIDADATFAMAYWGLAMSRAKLLWGQDDIDAGRSALTRMPSPDKLPRHDQAWVMAALSLFRRATADVRTSRREFLAVMEQLHAQYPSEESTLFLSIALLSTVRPGEPDEVALRTRAGELAAGVFAKNPKHPGAAHYLIHAYDTPELAEKALPAAKVYAQIAPAAFHAQHMPGHVFARMGMWKEAQASCQKAWDVSVAWVQRDKLARDLQDFHSLSWLVEIGFERGRRGDADAAMALYAAQVRAGLTHEKRAAFANQVTSYLGRTGEWKRADELLAPLQAPASDGTAGAGSLNCHGAAAPATPPLPTGAPPTPLFERRAVLSTHARAAAMLHDAAGVARALDERDRVDAELRPFLVATQPKELVESADRLRSVVRKALLARARKDDRALVEALAILAKEQEQEFTGEGTAGGVLHREDRAEALVRLGRLQDALSEYRTVLAKHAGRARSLLGAARVATKLGDATAARAYYDQLRAVWSEADPTTDGLDEVRRATTMSPR